MTVREQLRFLLNHLRLQRGSLAVLALAVAAGAVASLVGPVLLGRYIDAARVGAGQRVALAASLYLLTACALPVLNVVESWLATLVAWRSTNRLRIDLFRHCLAQDLDMIERHPPGALRWGPPPQRLVEARPEPRWRPAAGSPGALVICFH